MSWEYREISAIKVENLSQSVEPGGVQAKSSLSALNALAGLSGNHPIAGQITQVGAGNEHSIFLTSSGDVYAVGYNDNGQCGIGSNTPLRDVKKISGLTAGTDDKIAQIHVYNGCEHTLAISRTGKLYSFGYNYRGQLGNGTTISENVPRLVKGMIGRCVVLASCSYYHSILLCSDGTLWTMGRGDSGQLGHGDSVDSMVPRQLFDCVRNGSHCSGVPRNISNLSCGQYHTVVTTHDGDVYVCGKNDYGQLGLNTTEASVKLLTRCNNESESESILPTMGNQQSLSNPNPNGNGTATGTASIGASVGTGGMRMGSIKQACCGYYHTLFLTHTGVVFGCGRNDYGQVWYRILSIYVECIV